MKNITYAILGLILLLSNQTIAQNLIAVQNGGTPKFFTELPEAVNNAQAKDTIYIPGGSFSLNGTLIINKELHLIGVGHHPDSTATTGRTMLNGSIQIQEGASNGSVSGFLLNGSVLIGRTDFTDKVNNFTIERCNIEGTLIFQPNGNYNNACTFFSIKENIIKGEIWGGRTINNAFFNNIFLFHLGGFSINNIFKNNLILAINDNGATGCIFENNIFYGRFEHYVYQGNARYYHDDFAAINCIFNNNIHVSNLNNAINNSERANYQSQDFSTIFVNAAALFSYTDDYHVKDTSPGHHGGTDGTDVGIYGGTFPWKDGSIPSNPHFQSVQISGKTDNSGKLSVKIKVAAQDN